MEIWLAVILILVVAAVVAAVTFILLKGKYMAQLAAKDAQLEGLKELKEKEAQVYKDTLAELKESSKKAIDAAKTQLALDNEKLIKEREESLKKEAAETIKNITGGLDKEIKDMKQAFEDQKKAHAQDTVSIKTRFEDTVKQIREQANAIGTHANDLANALKGKNKMQGIFGETVLENIFKAEGLTKGLDYDTEFYLRDKDGNILRNEETERRLRPDFVLHFPDDTDVIIDSKVSLTALADYFEADDEAGRRDASRRNLESVQSHVKELTTKEYQKYAVGRKTLEYVIMFIPNYGAYQLAKQENPDIFADAFRQNVLITTEETLLPFVRLIRSAWVQKAQMDNMAKIVEKARDMVDRVALFCEEHKKMGDALEKATKIYEANSKRLTDRGPSIVKAALDVTKLGVGTTSRQLPEISGPIEIS